MESIDLWNVWKWFNKWIKTFAGDNKSLEKTTKLNETKTIFFGPGKILLQKQLTIEKESLPVFFWHFLPNFSGFIGVFLTDFLTIFLQKEKASNQTAVPLKKIYCNLTV